MGGHFIFAEQTIRVKFNWRIFVSELITAGLSLFWSELKQNQNKSFTELCLFNLTFQKGIILPSAVL